MHLENVFLAFFEIQEPVKSKGERKFGNDHEKLVLVQETLK